MCKFFSFVTEPESHPNQRFYFDWEYRKNHLKEDDADSHDHICKANRFTGDDCNKYEFNPLTREFVVDQINSSVDDRIQAEVWVNNLDFKKIVEPLIIKPIVNPFELRLVEKPTENQILLLKNWASVRASVWDSVWDSVGDSVGSSVRDSVWDSVGDSVRDSVWALVLDSVWASVWGYLSSFVVADYKYDFTPSTKLLESGLVPSFDGKTWRLHSGKNAKIVFEISAEDLMSYQG